jgi:transposase-like protein
VELALNTNRKHSEIAQDLGINQNTLARWKREMKQNETWPMKAFAAKGSPGSGVSVHAPLSGTAARYEDGRAIEGKPKRVAYAACKKTRQTRAGRPGAFEAYQPDK